MNPENRGPDAEKPKEGSEPEVGASELGGDAPETPISVGTDSICDLREAGVVSGPVRMGTQGTIEAYDLIRELGRGGMGTVLLARNSISGELVAIKTLRAEFAANAQAQERFNAEARHLRALRHPNIVPVLGWPESERVSYYVMPYCERGSLARLRGKPLGRDEVLGIAEPVAAALDHAHKQGVFHGDLKPGNILLGNEGQVYLADFGLARDMANPAPVKPGQDHCEGTMPYISPAVAAGEVEDTRRDVYGLGALMYEMLTGRPPYQGSNSESIRAEIRAGPPPRVLEVNPKGDPELAQVTEWAMAREQRSRYANVADLMSDLRRVKEGLAPLGPDGRTGLFRQPTAFAKRHWGRLAVGGGVILVALVVYGWWPRYDLVCESNLTNPIFQTAHLVVPAELNGLPGKELLVADRARLQMLDARGSRLYHEWIPGISTTLPIAHLTALDLDGDGRDEALVSVTQDTNLQVCVVNHQALEMRPAFEAVGPPHNPMNGTRTSWLRKLGFIPAYQSIKGRGMLVGQLQTLSKGGPRALLGFDVETRTNLWRWDVGPVTEDLQLVDLDGDNKPDILTGSAAPGNGATAPDGSSSDDRAYVFGVSQKGTTLFARPFLDGFGAVKVQAFTDSRKSGLSIFVCVSPTEVFHATNAPQQSKLLLLNEAWKTNAVFANGNCIYDFMVSDLNGDGNEEVVCADCKGGIYVLDAGLKLIRKRDLYSREIRSGTVDHYSISFMGTGPLLKGKKHIVAKMFFRRQDFAKNPGRLSEPKDPSALYDQRVMVLNPNLGEVASYSRSEKKANSDYGWTVQMADLDGDALQEILVHDGTLQVLKLRRR